MNQRQALVQASSSLQASPLLDLPAHCSRQTAGARCTPCLWLQSSGGASEDRCGSRGIAEKRRE